MLCHDVGVQFLLAEVVSAAVCIVIPAARLKHAAENVKVAIAVEPARQAAGRAVGKVAEAFGPNRRGLRGGQAQREAAFPKRSDRLMRPPGPALAKAVSRFAVALCLPPQSKAVRLGGIENYERKRHESRVHQSNRST